MTPYELGMFTKCASEHDDAAFAANVMLAGSTAAGMATSLFLGHRVKKQMENTPALPASKIPEVYKQVGVPADMPTYALPKLRNAMYVNPMNLKDKRVIQELGIGNSDLSKIKQNGMVVYDPAFNRAGIMAHEAGHANIRLRPWYSPSRINQGPLRTVGGLASMFAPTASFIAGANTDPLVGAGVGAGLGLLTGLPTLLNEAQASHHAKKYLANSSHMPDTIAQNKKALRRAYMTYVGGALVPAAVAGGLGGVFHNMYPNMQVGF